jgi:hypothetical protein
MTRFRREVEVGVGVKLETVRARGSGVVGGGWRGVQV